MAYDGSLIFDTNIDPKGFKEGVGKLGNIGKKAFGAVTTSVTAVATAIGAVGIASAKVGSGFESQMSGVASTMGITVDEINNGSESFELLKKAAKDAGASTKYSAGESAEALNYLALAGYDAEKSVEALPKVLNLAAAGGLELGYASDLVTDSMSALGMETDQLEGFVDELAKTSQKSNTNVSQLGEAILNIGGTAKIMAGGTVELNTQLGILADNGIKGAEGGTALRNVLLSLSAPTDKQAKAMKELGVETYDANGNFRSTDDIFQDLNGTLGDMSEKERTEVLSELFNKVDLKAANALLAGSGERFGELSNEIANSENAAAEMAETLNDNLKGKIGLLTSALEGLGIGIYESMEAPLKGVVETVTDYVGQISNVLTAHEDIEASAAELGMTAEELGYDLSQVPNGLDGAVEVIGDILADIIVKVADSAPKLLKAAVDLIKSFIEGILKNKDDVVQSAVDIITLLIETFFDLLPLILETGIELLIAFVEGILDSLPELVEGGKEMIDTLINVLVDNLPELIKMGIEIQLAFIQGLIASLPQLIDGVLQMVDVIIDVIIDNLPEIVLMGIEIIVALIGGLIKAIPQLVSRIPEIIDAIAGALAEGIVKIFDIGVDMVKGLWEGIKSMTSWIGDKVKGFASGVANGFKSFFGINSPSTLMAEFGLNIVEGLALGIKDNKTKAEKAMYDTAQSITQEYDRLGDAIITGLKNRYREEERVQLESLRKQTDEIRKESDKRIKEYNREKNEIDSILGMLDQADRDYASKMNGGTGKRYEDNAQNHNIIQAKKDWERFREQGDIEGMRAVEALADEMRRQGGTIGADVSLEDALRYSRSMQSNVAQSAGTMPRGQSSITNNNDNGIIQNVNIVNPEGTPSENARQLKKAGRELALGY